MSFLDLFRPRWKHSDASVRASSIRELDDSQTKELTQVVLEDRDPKIRRIAIKKISDPELLGRVLMSDEDAEVRKAASERRTALFLPIALSLKDESKSLEALKYVSEKDRVEIAMHASFASVSRAALVQIEDPKHLGELIRKSSNASLQKEALSRLLDQEVLKDLALGSLSKEMTTLVIEKIQNPQVLHEVFRRGSKALRQAIKDRHPSFDERKSQAFLGELSIEKKREKRQKIIRQAELFSISTDWDLASVKIAEAKDAWADLGSLENDKEDKMLSEQFERALSQFKSRKQAALAVLKQETEKEEKSKTLQALCQKMEALSESEESREIQQTRQEFLALGRIPESLQGLEKRFLSAYAQASSKKGRKGPEPFKAVQASSKADLTEAYDTHLARLKKICDDLEVEVKTAKRKVLEERLASFEDIVQNIEILPKEKQIEIRARFQRVRETLLVKIQEMREALEWKKWSERTSLEQLCLRIEALKEQPDARIFLTELKQIREAFQALPKLPSKKREPANADLRERFLLMMKEAQEKAKSLVRVLDEQRNVNLSQKESLCRELEAISNSGQWKETSARIKEIQAQWKTIGPVPKEQAQVLFQRFQAASRHFFARYGEQIKKQKAELEKNGKLKEALCVKMEELSSSKDWKRTTVQVKKLQTEWKAIGPVERAVFVSLNQRFRQACDQFFEKMNAHFKEQDEQTKTQNAQKQTLYKEMKTLLSQESSGAAYETLKTMRRDWKALMDGSKEGYLESEFQTLSEQVFDKNKSHFTDAQRAELQKEFSRFTNRISLPT